MPPSNNPLAISGSVGQPPSANRFADVVLVQQLLNAADAGLKEDGDAGPATVLAIRDYQRNFLTRPDGRVDPGGRTWQHLVERKLKVEPHDLVLLPQQSGLGYYSYASATRQFGTKGCITALREAGAQFVHNDATLPIGIGDISFQHGGTMHPHQSHKHGRHVDIRPLRTDRRRLPVSVTEPAYSRELTKLLVATLLAHRNVKSILFNDTAIAGVTSFAGHHNHLHVTMKE